MFKITVNIYIYIDPKQGDFPSSQFDYGQVITWYIGVSQDGASLISRAMFGQTNIFAIMIICEPVVRN